MRSYTVKFGTAPESILVVKGLGRALDTSSTNLSAFNYDSKYARHNGRLLNVERSASFDTPVRVWAKRTGWITVSGGRTGRTMTFHPDATVVFAVVNGKVVSNLSLAAFAESYC
jgi:hypothetical protein